MEKRGLISVSQAWDATWTWRVSEAQVTHDLNFPNIFILISLLASLQAEHGGVFPGSMSTVLILVCSPLQLLFETVSFSLSLECRTPTQADHGISGCGAADG